jgi:hypothetical protein
MVLAFVLAGCIELDLEDRLFRCDGDPTICGEGWYCQPDGFCVEMDGRELCGNGIDDDGDGLVDCVDVDCGLASCDDDNPCTIDSCLDDGTCVSEPVAGDPSCGIGCLCSGGEPTEIACGDRVDNDGDGLIDCQDDDCPGCEGNLECCDDGACRASCG